MVHNSVFLDLLESMNWVQDVIGPTHEKGHTLDLVITRETDSVWLGSSMIDHLVSDHGVANWSMNSIKPPLHKTSITYIKNKDIGIMAFKESLFSSDQMQDSTVDSADLDFIAEKFNSFLSNCLDDHVPALPTLVQ